MPCNFISKKSRGSAKYFLEGHGIDIVFKGLTLMMEF